MVTLDDIRKEMATQLQIDQQLKSVEVRADALDDALADAAVQLDTKVSSLDYEIIEKGFEGFMGIGRKPWVIRVYQNAETAAHAAKVAGIINSSNEILDEDEVIPDRDGLYYVHHFGMNICVKVVMPIGTGQKVRPETIISDIKSRPDTAQFDEKQVKSLTVNGTGGKYVEVGTYNHDPSADAIFVVDIAADEMEATCTITPPSSGGADVSPEMIEKALKTQGVVAGISDEKIQDLVDNPSYNVPVVVAEAHKPVDGRDAYIAYNFETDRSKLRAKEAANGQVNFKELNLIQNVVEGQPLAQKIPAEEGKAGKTLFGKYLEATNGKDISLPLGKNVKVDSDGRTILAAVNGQVMLVSDKICVEPIMEVEAVNIKTGNITFLGTVICKGNVEDGYDIKASGNIEISGAVGKCHIEADGDIIVSQGIMGRDEGHIICGGSLWAKFIQNTKVEVEENVIVNDSIMNSDVSAQRRIILQGKRAAITGGKLFATECILAKNIGSAGGGTETELAVGFDPRAKHRLEELQEMQGKNIRELEELELDISTLENLKKVRRQIPKEKEEHLVIIKRRRDEIMDENEGFNNEILEIQAHLRELKNIGKVYAQGTVYAGVKIFVRDEKDEVVADTKNVTFFYENGFVRRGKYEQPVFDDIKGPDGYSTN